jgi:hypothetical protein
MNDQNQNPVPNPDATPPVVHDWREQRQAERMARHEARHQMHAGRHSGWIGGTILILLGVVFLLQNLGIRTLVNWWAIFILIPALWAFVAAWNIYQDNNRLTRGVVSSLTTGVLLTLLSALFLLNVAVGLFWPVILIAGGLVLLIAGLWPA